MKKLANEELLSLYTILTKEKNYSRLLEIILAEVMDIAECDAGTLYVYENSKLHFKIMTTKSMNVYKGINDLISYPDVEMDPRNICSYCAIKREITNIPDVYESEHFNFEGPKKYDALTGYKTKSMLVIPMENDRGELMGVVQLINALDKDGNIISFPKENNKIIISLCMQAAICLSNLIYAKENVELLRSFVQTMSAIIDERSKFNYSHTIKMALYAERFLKWLEKTNNPIKLDDNKKNQLIMAIWLHDIGKLATPEKILNKSSRLEGYEDEIETRIKIFKLSTKLASFDGIISKEESETNLAELDEINEKIFTFNKSGYLKDEDILEINRLANREFLDENFVMTKVLKPIELHNLLVRKGSLTDEEREIMENHVVTTQNILSNMKFTRDFVNVPEWASLHHEFLDGSGYPNKFSEGEICNEIRIITIIDIFEALTAERPYKKPLSPEKSLEILNSMANEGKIDRSILDLFIESKAWELGKK